MTTLADWLRQDDFTCAMSSGFFGFFAHAGFLAALEEEGIAPNAFAGSSAGALISACAAAGLSANNARDALFAIRRQDFWDPRPGLGLLKGRAFHRELHRLLPVHTFADTERRVVMSAFDVRTRSTHVLSSGSLLDAVRASCCVPAMFQPVTIGGRSYLDGGILDRPGLAGVKSGTRVLYHHLASRSPWRRKGSPALKVPARNEMRAIVVQGLTRVSPYTLPLGQKAFAQAKEATRRALTSTDAVVMLEA